MVSPGLEEIDASSVGHSVTSGKSSSKMGLEQGGEEVKVIGEKETRRLNFIRILVVGILLVIGAVLSYFTYAILEQQVKEDTRDAVSYCSIIAWVVRC